MVPEGWDETTLEQVAEVAIGRTPARNEKSFWDPGKTTQNRWATIADIQSRYISETSEHISDLGIQHSNARLVPAGTLLMSFKLTLGRATITSKPMYTNEAIAAFYPNDRATTEYLYYLLPTLALEDSSDRAVKGRTLNKAKLRALRLALPPRAEQRKIAAILSSVDDAIEKTRAVIDQIQVAKRGLMQELITRGLPGRHTRFKQTEIGEIPDAWGFLPLGQLIKKGPDNGLYRPQSEYGEGVPIVRIDAFDNGDLLRRPNLRRVSIEPADVARFGLNPGDILINRVNSMSHLAKCTLAVSFDEAGVAMPRVVISGQKRRWGSCDRSGTIRLNWRIIQAPMRLVDYVVVHELVHLRHRGHGRDYWQALGRIMPDYERRREDLRRQGVGLAW